MLSNGPITARHLVFLYMLIGLLVCAVSYLVVLEKRREVPEGWRQDGRALQLEIRDRAKGCEDGVKKLTHPVNVL